METFPLKSSVDFVAVDGLNRDFITHNAPYALEYFKMFNDFCFSANLLSVISQKISKGGERIGKTPKKLASICCP
jgi:hypothetical protein